MLAGVAAVVGLAAAQLALSALGEPYLERTTVGFPSGTTSTCRRRPSCYALGLAVIGAVVAGVMPARKITRGLGTRLRAGPPAAVA